MKKILLAVFLLPILVFAQQQEQYSMYMMNNFLINPAEAGTEDFIDLQMGFRKQWANFDGAPQNIYLSGHAALNKETTELTEKETAFAGVGGALISDKIGPYSIVSAKAAYAYHVPVHKHFFLSLGAFAGVKSYQFDPNLVQSDRDESFVDPGISSSSRSAFVPDFSAGIWGYGKKLYFGISTFQMLMSDVKISSDGVKSKQKMHHWVTAGYNIVIDSAAHWNLVPSFVMKYSAGALPTVDLNVKVKYNNLVWGGVSYRSQDAVVLIAGVTLKNMIEIGYAYDITTSQIRKFSTGSHEVILGLRLANHEHKIPPPQFW